ncbi:unnamed protein product [Caenorhabditis angaria]|uniref:Uncharacterized protein n=1 Tax=Caenorhabditis angaria TaxID=860376 RepID=A0A9P1IV68_9PELO|nr:unnamed protein product [Caenorhabditis angaria]
MSTSVPNGSEPSTPSSAQRPLSNNTSQNTVRETAPQQKRSWSYKQDAKFRLAVGTIVEQDQGNRVSIVQLKENHPELIETASFAHEFPANAIGFIPDPKNNYPDLIATTGDCLRIWKIDGNVVEPDCVLSNHVQTTQYTAPLTNFDWNEEDPRIIGTASIDTTCTIYDIETGSAIGATKPTTFSVKTQLIAHDKPVHDIGFSHVNNGRDHFATVGADGSARMFDLRRLEHSTIVFEDPAKTPLMRLAWNKQEPHYLATFAQDATEVVILDIRMPCQALCRLKNHNAPVNGIAWAPHSPHHICTAGDDAQALIWDLQHIPRPVEDPILAYSAGGEVNQYKVSWMEQHQMSYYTQQQPQQPSDTYAEIQKQQQPIELIAGPSSEPFEDAMLSAGPSSADLIGSSSGGPRDDSRRKEIYAYTAPHTLYSHGWSSATDTSRKFRIAVSSFIEEYSNKISIVQLDEDIGEIVQRATFDHPYPATKIMWIPDQKGTYPDLLATSGDYLRLWRIGSNNQARIESLLNTNRTAEYCAPLTSFDWNENDLNLIGTSSIDTTCTVWQLETGQAIGTTRPAQIDGNIRTQLIAHDKEVFDISFSNASSHIFASVGADGSLRIFDLRRLEHSTIMYEDPTRTPLLRLSWNRNDQNYIATFAQDSKEVIILDLRLPCTPVARLRNHEATINGISWAPHSGSHICTAGDDRQALIWDVHEMPKPIDDPILAYQAAGEVNHIHWSSSFPDWISICSDNKLEILRV